jgi:hypothetical protein
MVHETRTARAPRGSGRVRARFVITLVGIAALVVGAFLDWQATQPGYRLTFRSLLHDDFTTTSNATKSVGAISVLIAAVALLALLDRTGWLTRLAGLASVVLFAMFALQLYRHYDQHFNPALHAVHVGAWATLGAGVVLLFGGLVRYRPKRRRLVREEDDAAVERARVSADTAVRPGPNEPIGEADRTADEDRDGATVELRDGERDTDRETEYDTERDLERDTERERELDGARDREAERADI